MHSKLCDMFGIDLPILAFSHCRDVVVEVSKAGGMGVLGMARMNPERVESELSWIDEHIDGKPYGVDVLMPSKFDDTGDQKFDPDELLPKAQVQFVRDMLDQAGVPPLPASEEDELKREIVKGINFTPRESLAMLEAAMRHPIKAIVNALGSPPAELVARAHSQGIKVGALAGKPRHAIRHREAGCDFVVAVGITGADPKLSLVAGGTHSGRTCPRQRFSDLSCWPDCWGYAGGNHCPPGRLRID